MSNKEKEEIISKFWEDNKIFEKSVSSRPFDKQFVFYDGPPFATGLPHYGHILGLTCKDLFPRYWTMKGYRVERRWGWDCHGLPIENIAENELGLKEKKDIEELGIAKFNEFCRSKVLFFASEWKKTVRRMGKWIEFDNSYKTMDNSYMETVWFIFKKLYEKDYVYQGKKILLYCPRCETPLSNAEIAMDNSYKDVTEDTVIAKFKLKSSSDTFFLAWTTTPWTLIGNVALAINKDLTYVKIRMNQENLILVKERLIDLSEKYEVLEEFLGEKLLNIEYEPLYHTPSDKKGHYVINGGSEVLSEDGTGIVHMAVYGEFDYEMIKKHNLPVIQHLGNQGKIKLGPEKFKNMWFKKADKYVIEDLNERNLLFKVKKHTHPYPFCYRCETPLFYNAVDSWFVDIQKIKSKLLERNNDINWYPNHLKDGRFKYILETAPDWSISRNRFWATSIPVWKCNDCNLIKVVGSIQELKEVSIEKIGDDVDLHKHIVDNIHIVCDKCKNPMSRIPEVFDCWFESGSMPYAAKHYPFENEEWFKDNFPADFISEYIAQVRAWFYYMHVLSVAVFDKAPFKNVVVSGNVLATDGTKMSKSKKNFPDPELLFDKYGADSIRFYLVYSPLMKAEDINFNEDGVKEAYRRVTTLLSNVSAFYDLFSDEFTPNNNLSTNLLDKWMVSKTNQLVKEVTKLLDDYNTINSCIQILNFIDDLSTWYVRRSRDRFKSQDEKTKYEALNTLNYVLIRLIKVMAPITPFISEEIHQKLRKPNKELLESVHLENWPEFDDSLIDETLHVQMVEIRNIVSKALDEREKAKISIRQALSELKIFGATLDEEASSLIKDELNVKKITFLPAESFKLELDTHLSEDLLIEGLSRELIRKINDHRKEMKLTIKDKVNLFFETDDSKMKECLTKHSEEIKKSTQTNTITEGLKENSLIKEIVIKDNIIKMNFEIVD